MKFEPYGVPIVKTYDVHHEDGTTTQESVTIRFSLSPKTLREPYNGTDAGKLDYGKHAKDNIGVSIVRAGRELELSQGFNISKDPRNRWWGLRLSLSEAWMTFLESQTTSSTLRISRMPLKQNGPTNLKARLNKRREFDSRKRTLHCSFAWTLRTRFVRTLQPLCV